MPSWAMLADYGYGEPRFIFYPPLTWMLGSILSFLVPWKLVPGIYVWAALTTAGLTMFKLANEWSSDRWALAAAIVFIVNPYHLLLVYQRWAIGELTVSAIFPLLLLLTLKLESTEGSPIWLAVIYSTVWLTNAPGAVVSSYALSVLLVGLAVRSRSLVPLVKGSLFLALGLGLAAFYIIPAAYEQKWVQIENAVSPLMRPESNFVEFFPPGNRRIILAAGTNAVIALALAGLAVRWRRRISSAVVLVALLTLAASILMTPLSVALWRHLPKLYFVQLPWRWLFVINAAAAFLVAFLLPTAGPLQRKFATACAIVYLVASVVSVGVANGESWRDLHGKIVGESGYWTVREYLPLGTSRHTPNESALLQTGSAKQAITFRRSHARGGLNFEFSPPAQGLVLLPLAWYPAWQAWIGDANPEVQNIDGRVAITVTNPTDTIRMEIRRTQDRIAGIAVSAMAFIFTAVLAMSRRVKDEQALRSSSALAPHAL